MRRFVPDEGRDPGSPSFSPGFFTGLFRRDFSPGLFTGAFHRGFSPGRRRERARMPIAVPIKRAIDSFKAPLTII
jgi:hypothetical protein